MRFGHNPVVDGPAGTILQMLTVLRTPQSAGQTSPQLAIMPLIDLVDHHLPTPEFQAKIRRAGFLYNPPPPKGMVFLWHV